MTGGLRKGGGQKRVYVSLDDWVPAECNIVSQSWPFNQALSDWDKSVQDLLTDFDKLKVANHPHWPAVLPPLPPLPIVPERWSTNPIPRLRVPGRKPDSNRLGPSAQRLSFFTESGYVLPASRADGTTDHEDDEGGTADFDFTDTLRRFGLRDIRPAAPIPRRNMHNGRNGCYYVSLLQLLHNIGGFRQLFTQEENFKFLATTNMFTAYNDDGRLQRHRALVRCLTALFRELDTRGEQLPRKITVEVLDTLYLLSDEFTQQENDPTRVTVSYTHLTLPTKRIV